MSWPRDDAKLERVRALMAEHELDALVVRAPDNVLYLTNFWGMKGYDACVFPREGEPVLICLEASEEDAARTAWTSDVRLFKGYDPIDPRPPTARVLELAREAASEYGRVGLELSLGTQAADRMVGEPTTFTRDWFTAFGDVADATPLLAAARALKTEQEIERMRLANDIAAAAMEHCKLDHRAGHERGADRRGVGGVRPRRGHRLGGQGRARARLLARLVRARGSRRSRRRRRRPVVEGEPTLFEIWVCADGYWCDHTKNLVAGELTPQYRELEAGLMAVYDDAIDFARPARASPSSTGAIRAGIDAMGFPGQPSHPICHGVGARAHEPPYAHQAGGGEIAAGMVLAIEPGCYIEGGGGLRVEDNFLSRTAAPRSSRRSRMG